MARPAQPRPKIRGIVHEELPEDDLGENLAPDVKYDYQRPMPIKIAVGKQNIRVNVTGPAAFYGRSLASAFQEIAQDLKLFTDQLQDFLPNDLAYAMQPTFELSQEYCPVGKTGNLKGSGYLEAEAFRDGTRVEVGYGKNGFPDYAIFVHERVDAQHTPPTKAKFLEDAINEDFFNLQDRIVQGLKIRLGDEG